MTNGASVEDADDHVQGEAVANVPIEVVFEDGMSGCLRKNVNVSDEARGEQPGVDEFHKLEGEIFGFRKRELRGAFVVWELSVRSGNFTHCAVAE